jgi:hypothetical protein
MLSSIVGAAPQSRKLLRRVGEHVVGGSSGLKLWHLTTLAKAFASLRYGEGEEEGVGMSVSGD